MMRKLLFKYVLILGICLISYIPVSSKPDDTELKQTLEKAFKVDKSVNLSLYNKYGDVVVKTWDTDSVKVFIEITAYGKKLDDVKKTLGKVDFDFDHTAKFLTLATVINRKSSSTPSFWSDLGDKFGKDKLSIDYEIFIPRTAYLQVENKFGDIYVDVFEGRSSFKLSHGNLKINQLKRETYIELNYGSAYIKRVNKGSLNFQIAEVELHQAGSLDVRSSSSELYFKAVDNLKIISRNDKLTSQKIGMLIGKGNFSKFTIDSLKQKVDMNIDYGRIMVNHMDKNFLEASITGTSTDVYLQFPPVAFYSVDIIAKEGALFYPESLAQTTSDFIDEKEKYISVQGFMGARQRKFGRLKLHIKNGEIKITQ